MATDIISSIDAPIVQITNDQTLLPRLILLNSLASITETFYAK
ncbi:hypothetical protein [Marinomonas sp. CT5]|nr:hypothetical protein [Marinomonas sp. CT5]